MRSVNRRVEVCGRIHVSIKTMSLSRDFRRTDVVVVKYYN